MTYTDDTKKKIVDIMKWAKANGIVEVTINAGELGKALSLYGPGCDNNVRSVYLGMKDVMEKDDLIINEPPSGEGGASFTIKYKVR